MENPRHWNFAESFSGRDAAYLIIGIDPSTYNAESEYKAQPIIGRMKKSYYSTCKNFEDWVRHGYGEFDQKGDFKEVDPFKGRSARENELWCIELERLVKDYNNSDYIKLAIDIELQADDDFFTIDPSDLSTADIQRLKESGLRDFKNREIERRAFSPLLNWASKDVHEFCDQKFSRNELHRWITDNNLPSAYCFTEIEKQSLSKTTSYPWGNHSTNLLDKLSSAANKFWTLYDSSDPGTAPTNAQVEAWLVDQGVPKRTAEVMATILRADGLQTGRRK